MDIACELSYKYPIATHAINGECLEIVGTRITFLGAEPVDRGLAIELNVAPDNPMQLSLRAFAEALSCSRQPSGNYEISCEIKGVC